MNTDKTKTNHGGTETQRHARRIGRSGKSRQLELDGGPVRVIAFAFILVHLCSFVANMKCVESASVSPCLRG